MRARLLRALDARLSGWLSTAARHRPNFLEPDLVAEVTYTCSWSGDVRAYVSKLDVQGPELAAFCSGMVRNAIVFASSYGVEVGITVNGQRIRLNDFVPQTTRRQT